MNIVKQIVKAAQEDLKIKNSNTINGINQLSILNVFLLNLLLYCLLINLFVFR